MFRIFKQHPHHLIWQVRGKLMFESSLFVISTSYSFFNLLLLPHLLSLKHILLNSYMVLQKWELKFKWPPGTRWDESRRAGHGFLLPGLLPQESAITRETWLTGQGGGACVIHTRSFCKSEQRRKVTQGTQFWHVFPMQWVIEYRVPWQHRMIYFFSVPYFWVPHTFLDIFT